MSYVLYTDGAAQPNPGPYSCGAVLLTKSSQKVVWTVSEYLGPEGTNNMGELTGILRGVSRALEIGAKTLEVHSDSELSVNLITGKKKTEKPHLSSILEKIQPLLKQFEKFEIHWIKAHNAHVYNEMADSLASHALDTYLPPPVIQTEDLDLGDIQDDAPPPPTSRPKSSAPRAPLPEPTGPVLFLKCPFAEKDQVKKKGARWNPQKKQWYAEDTPENRRKFAQWLAN